MSHSQQLWWGNEIVVIVLQLVDVPYFDILIDTVANKMNVHPDMIAAIIMQETSGGRVNRRR